MKQIILSVALTLLTMSTVAGAQVSAQNAPNMFPTMAACKEALTSGRARFYEPKYFGLKTRNPTNGVDRVVVHLESNVCLEMLVVGGRQFVAQREGTPFRAYRLADGSLSLYARDDCGNPVYGLVYAAPVVRELRDPVVHEAPPSVRYTPEPVGPVAKPQERFVRPEPTAPEKKDGFCSSKKCRWTLAVIGASAAGYATWRLWPCPPGTVRR